MGMSTIGLGISVNQEKTTKGEEISMNKGGSLDSHVFSLERRDKNGRECIGAGATMEGKFWIFFQVEE
jgi:hypothetical protein